MGWSEKSSLVAATLLGLALSPPAFAEPIPPQPLWGQLESSRLVVVARVESKERLRVLETWKGERSLSEVPVSTPENLVCPAPGRFVVGETVLAFLTLGKDWTLAPGEDDGRWHPVGLRYGTLYLDPAGLDAYRTLAKKALALQQRGKVTEAERIAWLLEATAHAATRWNGLMDLDESSTWDPVKEMRVEFTPLARKLTPRQRGELVRSFVAEPSGVGDLVRVLPMVAGVRDPRLEGTVVEVLDRELTDDCAHDLLDALEPVARWAGVPPPSLPDRIWYLTKEARREAIHDAWFDLRTRILTTR